MDTDLWFYRGNGPGTDGAGGGFTGWGDPASQAYSFGPSNTFITVPINIDPATLSQVTFGAWVKASDLSNVIRGIISHDTGDFDRTLDLDVRGPSANLQYCMFAGAGGTSCCADVTTDWTFLVARYDAVTGTGQLTVNGTHSATISATPGSGLATTTIGCNPNFDSPFVGLIDNAFFFDEYLSNDELNDIYRGGINAVPEPSTWMLFPRWCPGAWSEPPPSSHVGLSARKGGRGRNLLPLLPCPVHSCTFLHFVFYWISSAIAPVALKAIVRRHS